MTANAECIPWYSEPGVALYQGDTRAVMAQMPAETVDCVVFSPPFFGLRVYAGAQELVWGGKDGCEHEWQERTFQRRSNDSNPGAKQGTNVGSVGRDEPIGHSTCSLCGAWHGAWGLEPSVELWVAHTVEVMQAVKRVLKPTGVAWVEVGDSYVGGGPHHGDKNLGISGGNKGSKTGVDRTNLAGLKPKDLCLVPERLALALQADGWWVRSRIVWAKPNPMPESVSDRPTKAHSTIWMLTKAESYFWDGEAVREPHDDKAGGSERFGNTGRFGGYSGDHRAIDGTGTRGSFPIQPGGRKYHFSGRNLRDLWEFPTAQFGYELCQSCGQIYTAAQFGRLPERVGGHRCKCQGQDEHTDWQEAVIEDSHDGLGAMMQPAWLCPDCETIYSLAEWNGLPQGRERLCRCGAADFLSHFATFPEALPSRCILASTSEAGCCPKCGRPWTRVLKKGLTAHDGVTASAQPDGSTAKRLSLLRQAARERGGEYQNQTQTLGWAPTCTCGLPQAENVPATVLDVCVGSGTAVVAAKRLGRRGIGIDLSMAYLKLTRRRLEEIPLPLRVKGGCA